MKKMKIAGLVLLSLIIGTKLLGQTGSTETVNCATQQPGQGLLPESTPCNRINKSCRL